MALIPPHEGIVTTAVTVFVEVATTSTVHAALFARYAVAPVGEKTIAVGFPLAANTGC
ncbi:MAG: hypothetical protein RIR88_661 [Actinomycetota bacterium]